MKTIIIAFLSSLSSTPDPETLKTFQAENLDIHIGQESSQTASVDHLTITWENDKLEYDNMVMDTAWENDTIYLRNKSHEIMIPFIPQTSHNELNQYHINQAILEFETQKHFKVKFKNAEFKLKESLFLLKDFYLTCERKYKTTVSNTMELCLTDKTSGRLSSLSLDSDYTAKLKNFISLRTKRKLNQNTQSSKIKDTKLSIQKNRFELKTKFQGKSISVKGSVHYDPINSHLNIVITKAGYLFFSIKDRIYKELRSLRSEYLFVDHRNVIIFKLDRL